MTLGDIIEKIRVLFGGEPTKVRKFRERIASLSERIKSQEDERREMLKRNSALEGRIADLKRDLKTEASAHNQDLIMDEIDSLEKEFGRTREEASQKLENLNANRVLLTKLKQLLEQARNGGSYAELEDVIGRVGDMKADQADIAGLVAELDRPARSAKSAPSARSRTEDADRAARRARILGERAPAPAETSSPAKRDPATAASGATAAEAPSPAASSEEPQGVVAAN